MKRYGILLAVALLSAMLLAGCGGADDLDAGTRRGNGSGDDPGAFVQAPAHRFSDEASKVTVVETGTISGTDQCVLADGFCDTTNPGFRQEFDITDQIEPGVPTGLSLSFEYDNSGIIFGTSYSVILMTKDTTVVTTHEKFESGLIQIEAELVTTASSSVKIETKAYGLGGFEGGIDWTLTVDLEGASGTIEPGVPVLVPGHADNHGLNITTPGSGNAEFILWANDQIVAINETADGHFHYPIPEEDRRVDHVILLREGSAPVTVNATGLDPVQNALRALVTRWEPVGSAYTLTPGDREEWEFELDRTPMAVGIAIRSNEDSLTGRVAGAVTGPGAELFELDEGCPNCWGLLLSSALFDEKWEHLQRTPYGADALGPGTYAVEIEYDVFIGEVWGYDSELEVQAYQIVFSP